MEIRITEEEISFTPEIMEKLLQLRENREINNRPNPKGMKDSFQFRKDELVYIRINGTKFTGKIECVKELAGKILYDVSSPYGIIKNVGDKEITKRVLEDLSDVIIPDELKKLNTRHLLSLLRKTYYLSGETSSGIANHMGVSYTYRQIKAALIGRPHVSNSRERKNVKNRNKR